MSFVQSVIVATASTCLVAGTRLASRNRVLSAATILYKTSLFYSLLLFLSTVWCTVGSIPVGEARIHHQTVLSALGEEMSSTEFHHHQDWTPPLRTQGRHIVDKHGKRFKLASVNWYGASDIYFVPGGLDKVHRNDLAATIKKMGFNSVRFPYSDQMVIENPIVDPVWLQANLDLLDPYTAGRNSSNGTSRDDDLDGPRAIEVFNACVKALTDAGIAVIINDHITNAHWCDGMNLCDSSWRNDQYGPVCNIRQTTETWIDHWRTIMTPFIDNPFVIGADLRNEPRGVWGTMTWKSWAAAAERAGEELLKMQPSWLMIVEGISSANDCSGARRRPVKYSVPNRVVYSAHVYQWSGWSSTVPYGKREYASFALDMERNWAFLIRGDIAPVWVGEFGAPRGPRDNDKHYWDNLMKYLQDVDADWGYWALNAHKPDPYDPETYGLLRNDWSTIIEDYRMQDMRKLMQ